MKKNLKNRNILIGVTGGIAAYKIPELIRLLQKEGANVSVVITENGRKFVSPYTLNVLTSGRCFSDPFGDGIPHIDLSRWADIIVIAPATYNTVGKIASGIADNLLTALIAASDRRTLIFPAMNTNMYENPVHQKNLDYLRSLGYEVITPGEGPLACGEEGPGRMPDPETIVMFIDRALGDGSYRGESVIVTAGGTEESIDPVRVITNRSSGRMGLEIAGAFFSRGADVTFIHGRIKFPVPDVFNPIYAPTSKEMEKAINQNLKDASILVMAAAISDFVPEYSKEKIKRGDKAIELKLKPGKDILSSITKKWHRGIVVGFTLEEDSVLLERAIEKMKKKGCDVMVANSINALDSENSRGYIITEKGEEWFENSKEELAWIITEKVRQLKS